MIKGIILDFDQTIVDSSKVEYLRDLRRWNEIPNHYYKLKLNEGVKEFFDFLYENNVKIAIVSNAPRNKYLKGLIKHFNLKVDVVIGYEDVQRRKPNTEPMIKAANLLNLNKKDIISIGDQINDIISSNNANIRSIYYGKQLKDENQLCFESFIDIRLFLSKK